MESSIQFTARAANDSPQRDRAIDALSFEYKLLSPRSREDRYSVALAYDLWKSVWSETLLELDGSERVHSDEFSRQDEIGALFYEGQCVGLTLHRWLDLDDPWALDDTYFVVWPGDAQRRVVTLGSRVCICSNLTVAPAWRRSAGGFSTKEMLLALAVKRFLSTDAAAMLGTPRNGKGMNNLGYRMGATPIVEGATLHGVEIDLVAHVRATMGALVMDEATEALVESLFEEANQQEIRHANRIERLPRTAQSRA